MLKHLLNISFHWLEKRSINVSLAIAITFKHETPDHFLTFQPLLPPPPAKRKFSFNPKKQATTDAHKIPLSLHHPETVGLRYHGEATWRPQARETLCQVGMLSYKMKCVPGPRGHHMELLAQPEYVDMGTKMWKTGLHLSQLHPIPINRMPIPGTDSRKQIPKD